MIIYNERQYKSIRDKNIRVKLIIDNISDLEDKCKIFYWR